MDRRLRMPSHFASIRCQLSLALSQLALLAAACGGSPTGPNPNPNPGPPTPSAACASQSVLQLDPGQHAVVNPAATGGCLRLPAAGAQGAQYLMVLASTASIVTSTGVQGTYLLRTSSPAVLSPAPEAASEESPPPPPPPAPIAVSVAAQFDATLRARERELLRDPGSRAGLMTAPPVTPAPPAVGDTKSFKTCSNLQCSAFTTVPATVVYVGQHVAIFQDNSVPQADPLQPADFAELGVAFDTYHYPIDTTAFGRESDQDGNGVVEILMTDAVNDLTPDCTNGRVIGYFFGGDLLNGANSNHAEVFYTLVPAPATAKCTAVSRRAALDNLKPTLIHEFQHMISFNQHALIRAGDSEEGWLNEALSHFAEELGGRLIPNSECVPNFPSCRSQYASGDIQNAYAFLRNSEATFLLFGTQGNGTLEERGAGWLFLRWCLDQFSTDSILGTSVTRALDNTALLGVTNLTAATGGTFSTMVPEWLMATYLDDGSELPFEPTGRLRFKSWGLRSIWTDPRNATFFPLGFPVVPEPVGPNFSRSGSLHAGTGHHFIITQQALGAALDILVLRSTAADALDPALGARFGIVRIN